MRMLVSSFYLLPGVSTFGWRDGRLVVEIAVCHDAAGYRRIESGMDRRTNGIRIVAIGGAVRPGNYTMKALRLVLDEFAKHERVTAELIDPAALRLSPPGVDLEMPDSKVLREKVRLATGVVLATPEYHGSFSSVIKLVIENLGFPSVLAGKPVALLGVAQGGIGAIKSLESLAGVCLHVGAIVLPGAVSVAAVQRVFDAEGRCLDAAVETRVRQVASSLVDYIRGAICPRLALEAMVRGEPSLPR
jgi:chromate reductase